MSVKIGDRVGYTAAFVRGAGGSLHSVGARRGVVKFFRGDLAYVHWEYDDEGSVLPVHVDNIARVGSAAFSDANVGERRRSSSNVGERRGT